MEIKANEFDLKSKNSISKKNLGMMGENHAIDFLQQKGLKIIDRNYRCPIGEMDVIASDKEVLVFIEVRTRSSGIKGWGEESITYKKKQRLYNIAKYYIRELNYREWPKIRFDIIAIRHSGQNPNPETLWFKGIF